MATIDNLNALLKSGMPKEACVVMGNESCDMDSIVTSLVYATYLSQKEKRPVVPILNVEREDLALRSETTWALQDAGVDLEKVIFAPEVDWDQVGEIVLVDHNLLCPAQSTLGPKVIEVLDHHADSGKYIDQCRNRAIRTVGSASTLAAIVILQGNPMEEEPILSPTKGAMCDMVAKLLLGTIMVDTMNNDPAMKKTTPLDRLATKHLSEMVWGADAEDGRRDELYKKLSIEKFNTSGLTIQMSLRKDYKKFSFSDVEVGMASILESLESLAGKGDLHAEMEQYKAKHNLDILIIMSLTQTNGIEREIATTHHTKLLAELADGPLSKELELKEIAPVGGVTVFKQNNVAVSRKVLTPKLEVFFASA
eukprot:TRINITY_DN6165_c0_g1_i1.p1 TRINITY_DN6165_c0_g1~~TRINITY_DN6165_c0_g1_i1.p1  ORF type:complete len:382 (+),score=108.30 TRINITY_DN6165_c0_g1_i1:49-1146(+)